MEEERAPESPSQAAPGRAAPVGGGPDAGEAARPSDEAAPPEAAPAGPRPTAMRATEDESAKGGAGSEDDAAEDGDGDEDGNGADEAAAGARPARKKTKRAFSPVPPERLVGAVEAMLLAAGDVLTPERLRELLALPSVIPVREAVEEVERRFRAADLAVEIRELAGGWRVTTRPEYAEYVARLRRRGASDRLSPSLLETLSIVAYRQPVPRVEVERIRGVASGDALRALLDRRLLKVVGRSDQPGRPLLYGTTRRFLEVFGLSSLSDLPAKGDLRGL